MFLPRKVFYFRVKTLSILFARVAWRELYAGPTAINVK